MEQLLIVEDDIGLNQGLCKALKADDRQIISCVTAQPQPSSKNRAGAKPGSSKLQIFFLQTSGSLSDHGSRSFKNARSFGSCFRP